ncbi:DMT family transporter [Schaalia vaccimaxillae]|uniref:DMT family transporter n=1 Tax=Schaalia vaccimaxillae TaxID=183916 RepID=UPI0003B626E4|nr:DMT family transporter [Schaalia vaccimaxillae]
MLFLFAGIFVGFLMPLQTAINSRLRAAVTSPIFASLISFTVGTVALILVVSINPGDPLGIISIASSIPWWQWLGGVMGLIFLTTNILIFPRLGGVETAIWPVLGEILASVVIDHFGWLEVTERPVNLLRGIGLIFVIAGVLAATVLKDLRNRPAYAPAVVGEQGLSRWLWRFAGLFAGACSGTQGAVNGALGRTVGTPVQAALVSFVVGTAGLVVLVALLRQFPVRTAAWNDHPKWMWIGGLLGAVFVFTMAALVPRIGTGPAMVAALTGQTAGSICVDHFGWLEAPHKRVVPVQLVGLGVMLAGVLAVQLG